jgi:hypothetical protein
MKYLYEILIRGNPDGTLNGAHQVMAEEMGGNLIVGHPMPLDMKDVGAVLEAKFVDFANAKAAQKLK